VENFYDNLHKLISSAMESQPFYLTGIIMNKSRKNQRFLINTIETMERREVLSGATIEMYPGKETIFPTPGPGTVVFSTELTIVRDINNNSIDFNNDGSPDLLNECLLYSLLNYPSINGASVAGNRVLPMISDVNGEFFASGSIDGGQGFAAAGSIAAVFDWNGDGNQDFITAAYGDSGEYILRTYQNDGYANFTTAITQYLPDENIPAGQELCMSDYNQDGALDILVPVTNSKSFRLFNGILENGKWNGLFDTTNYQTLNYVGSLNGITPENADLNGDGFQDIVIPDKNGLRIFINNGNGQFPADGSLELPSIISLQSWNVLAADFNNDGKIDLAGSYNNPVGGNFGQIYAYLNTTSTPTTGNPTFGTVFGVGSSNGIYGQLVAADMNLDGNLDIVTPYAVGPSDSYYILTNDGTGSFSNERLFNAHSRANNGVGGIGVGDWNKDGQLDVVSGMPWVNAANSNISEMTVGVSLAYNRTFQPIGLSISSLPAAMVGTPYSYQLQIQGGDSQLPYNVSLNSLGSRLPAGLTLSPTGLISGTPTQSGPFQLIFDLTQSNGLKGISEKYLSVEGNPPINILPGALPNGVAGLNYQVQLTSTGGPSLWSITQGSLPAGLTLTSGGLLSGLPQAVGNYNFQVSATGANGSSGQINYVLTIQAAAAPVVTRVGRYGYHAQPTVFVVTYSQPMTEQSATNLSNYSLVMAGRDGIFGTRDDRNVPLRSAVYDAQTNGVTLIPMQRNVPLHQKYQLTIVSQPTTGVQNTSGVFLGGQGAGAPGTNFVTSFGREILSGPSVELMAKARRRILRPKRFSR
jgi:hypothetical protein